MTGLKESLIGDPPAKLSPLQLTADLFRLMRGKPTSVQMAKARLEAKEGRREHRAELRRQEARDRAQARRRLKQEEKLRRRDAARDRQGTDVPVVTDKAFAIDNIELTNRCPMRCVMCPRTKHMTRAQGHMELETFRLIIDQYLEASPTKAKEDGVYLHHFGESIVHPEFDAFIRYANEQGVATRISINPLMLKPRSSEKLLAANPTEIMFSLDGHDDESFYRIRGVKNAYDLSVQRLLDFLKQKVESGCRSHVELSMIDFSENEESIAEMRSYWEGVEGIDEFVLKTFITWDGSAQEINDFSSFLVDNEERRKKHSRPSCNLPWRKMTVTWDGDVVPCCYDFNKKFALGNVREQSLEEIWNGPMMQALRQEFNSNHVTNALCKNCSALYSD